MRKNYKDEQLNNLFNSVDGEMPNRSVLFKAQRETENKATEKKRNVFFSIAMPVLVCCLIVVISVTVFVTQNFNGGVKNDVEIPNKSEATEKVITTSLYSSADIVRKQIKRNSVDGEVLNILSGLGDNAEVVSENYYALYGKDKNGKVTDDLYSVIAVLGIISEENGVTNRKDVWLMFEYGENRFEDYDVLYTEDKNTVKVSKDFYYGEYVTNAFLYANGIKCYVNVTSSNFDAGYDIIEKIKNS